MSHNRGTTNKTSVQLLITLFSLLYTSGASTAFAQGTTSNSGGGQTITLGGNSNLSYNCQQAVNAKTEADKTKYEALCNSELNQPNCKDKLVAAQAAKKAIGEACAEGQLGSEADCFAKAFVCEEVPPVDTSESNGALMSTINSILTSQGISTGGASMNPVTGQSVVNKSDYDKTCPQMTRGEYRDEKKRLEKEINDAEKEVTDIQKDLIKEEKDTQKDMAKITKDTQKAKEDADKAKQGLDDDLKKSVSDIQKAQAETKSAIVEANLKLIQKRSELAKKTFDQSEALASLNNDETKDACALAAQNDFLEQKKKFRSSQTLAMQKWIRDYVMHKYRSCLDRFDRRRQAVVMQYRADMDDLTATIKSAEVSLEEAKGSIDKEQKNINDLTTDTSTRKTLVDNGLLQTMQTAQTELQAAQTGAQKTNMTFSQKQQKAQERINTAQNELNSMGPIEKAGAKSVAGKIDANIGAVVAYIEGCSAQVDSSMKSTKKLYDEVHNQTGSSDSGNNRSRSNSNSSGGNN